MLNRLGWHGLLAYHFYPNWLPDSNGKGGIFLIKACWWIPFLKPTCSPLKVNGWKTIFLLGRPFLSGYVSFSECSWNDEMRCCWMWILTEQNRRACANSTIIGACTFRFGIEDQYIFFSLQHNVCCTNSEEGQRSVSKYAQKVLEDLADVGSERV